jgi:hypothetical protein
MTENVKSCATGAAVLLCILAVACAGLEPPSETDGQAQEQEGDDVRADECGGEVEAPPDAGTGEDEPDDTDGTDDGDAIPDPEEPERDAGAPDDTDEDDAPDAGSPYADAFVDDFDALDRDVWGCEYTCPTAEAGALRFTLKAGIPPDREGSWSKIGYRGRRFTSGRFTVRYALTARPAQKVWWGTALWDDGPNPDGSAFNEINFGYTTPYSFSNTQLLFESARLGNYVSIKVDTGVDLYDGAFHTATLEYDAEHVAFYFDGVLMETITDREVIPTDPMKFIIGPRLVTGSAPLAQDFTESVEFTKIEW